MPLLLTFLEPVGRFAAFAGRTLLELPGAVLTPRSLGRPLHGMLLGALPLALATGAALGIVAWLQIRGLLFNLQSASLLPSALALGVVWEMGPVTAGLIAAGRLGAGLGAELGAMKITEQVDALEALALSPLRRLVIPRVLACMVTLPLLTLFIDYVAILASYLAETVGGTMSAAQYRIECLRYLRLRDAIPATLKTTVFGYLIGVTGCYLGLSARAGTEGVGRAATRSVVLSTLLVLLADVVLVKVIQLFLPPG